MLVNVSDGCLHEPIPLCPQCQSCYMKWEGSVLTGLKTAGALGLIFSLTQVRGVMQRTSELVIPRITNSLIHRKALKANFMNPHPQFPYFNCELLYNLLKTLMYCNLALFLFQKISRVFIFYFSEINLVTEY